MPNIMNMKIENAIAKAVRVFHMEHLIELKRVHGIHKHTCMRVYERLICILWSIYLVIPWNLFK